MSLRFFLAYMHSFLLFNYDNFQLIQPWYEIPEDSITNTTFLSSQPNLMGRNVDISSSIFYRFAKAYDISKCFYLSTIISRNAEYKDIHTKNPFFTKMS